VVTLDDPVTTWSAALVPQIDRLALCIHRPTGRRPDLVAALRPLGLPPHSFVVAAARCLAAGELTLDDVCLLSRYESKRWSEASLRRHLERGLLSLRSDGVTYVPTPGFQAGAGTVLALQAEEAERLWHARPAALEDALRLASLLVQEASGSHRPLPAFRQQTRAHHVLPSTDAGQLLGYMTELRYLRSDVHADCLAGVELVGPPARVLHRLWRGFPPGSATPEVLDVLAGRGLVAGPEDGSQWTITGQGRHLCQTVEEATNVDFGQLFHSVSEPDRGALLAAVAQLDGEDPRPVEDR